MTDFQTPYHQKRDTFSPEYKLPTSSYIFMGWMAVFVLPYMLPIMERDVLVWIGAGGFFYTFGVLFYVREKLLYSHAIWHVFVLAGTASHALALWLALLDLGGI